MSGTASTTTSTTTTTTSTAILSRGRPVCEEFEEEVMAECENSLLNNTYTGKKASAGNEFSYCLVKNCAVTIWNKDYWDEENTSFIKKWQLNRTTARLAFTNKWVYGLLRRQQSKRASLPPDTPHAVVKAATAAASASKQVNPTSASAVPKINMTIPLAATTTVAPIDELITSFIPTSLSSSSDTEDHQGEVENDLFLDQSSYNQDGSTNSSRGRPVCEEFEEEVIAECESSLESNCFKRKRASSGNDYSYAQVKQCAAIVMDKEYWDEGSRSFVKKWQLNRRTCSLSFTNKWVCGMLRRYSKKLRLQELHECAECLATLSVIRVNPDDSLFEAAVMMMH